MNQLSPQQLTYIRHRLAGDKCTVAARKAGYPAEYARRAATSIEKQPAIAAAIADARNKIRRDTAYTLERMISETQDAIRFAFERQNPMAVMKGNELLAKLTGLLTERQKIEIETPDLRMALSQRQAAILLPQAATEQAMRDITPKAAVAPQHQPVYTED
jgi:phage terminase small subunit